MAGSEYVSVLATYMEALQAALGEIDDGTGQKLGSDRVIIDSAAVAGAVGPAIIIGPPTWTYETFCQDGPSDVSLSVYVLARNDDQAVFALMSRTLAACEAIEGQRDVEASVTGAVPGMWVSPPSVVVPAYIISVSGSLTVG